MHGLRGAASSRNPSIRTNHTLNSCCGRKAQKTLGEPPCAQLRASFYHQAVSFAWFLIGTFYIIGTKTCPSIQPEVYKTWCCTHSEQGIVGGKFPVHMLQEPFPLSARA